MPCEKVELGALVVKRWMEAFVKRLDLATHSLFRPSLSWILQRSIQLAPMLLQRRSGHFFAPRRLALGLLVTQSFAARLLEPVALGMDTNLFCSRAQHEEEQEGKHDQEKCCKVSPQGQRNFLSILTVVTCTGLEDLRCTSLWLLEFAAPSN